MERDGFRKAIERRKVVWTVEGTRLLPPKLSSLPLSTDNIFSLFMTLTHIDIHTSEIL